LIHVVVGVETLLGADRPAELLGHGPIDAAAARALAADGIWKRLLTDPASGTLLDVGRTSYTPPAGLADHVRARDQICRGPQCGRRIRDLDHHQEWGRDGHTAEPNLFSYCQHHHKLKDAPGWQVIAHPDRSLTWISPCGRRHRTEPFDYRPFTDDLPGHGPTHTAPAAGETEPEDQADDTPPPF
jgi:hypothetical protein